MSELHRRIEDHLLAALDMACEQRRIEVAELLLRTIEVTLTRKGGIDRRDEIGPVAEAFAKVSELKRALEVA